MPHWGSHKEAVAIRNKSQNVRPIQCDLHKKVCPPLTAKADHTWSDMHTVWAPAKSLVAKSKVVPDHPDLQPGSSHLRS